MSKFLNVAALGLILSTGAAQAEPLGLGRPATEAEIAAWDIDIRPDGPALATLERWYRNAARMLAAVRTAVPEAAEIRIWPHHFDIATLATFDGPDVDPEAARSLGFGLSPGDDVIPEPYWYLLPWPVPPEDRLERLAVGSWQTQRFVGATLTGAHDERTVARFFESAADISRRAIGIDPK